MARVLVPLAEGFEEMEGIIVIDVLRRAGLEVISAGLHSGPIIAARGTRHLADVEIDAVVDQDFDLIVLPGGLPGATNLQANKVVQTILARMKRDHKHIAAICAAPNVLRNLGIIESNDKFTIHPSTLDMGQVGQYVADQRVVQSGKITTSIGPGSAFEFALELVEQFCGHTKREQVAKPMYLP